MTHRPGAIQSPPVHDGTGARSRQRAETPIRKGKTMAAIKNLMIETCERLEREGRGSFNDLMQQMLDGSLTIQGGAA